MTYDALLWTTLIVCTLLYRPSALSPQPHFSRVAGVAARLHITITTLLVVHVLLHHLQEQASLSTLFLHTYGTWISILLGSLLLIVLPFPTSHTRHTARLSHGGIERTPPPPGR